MIKITIRRLLLAAALLFFPAVLSAHTHLHSSKPAKGDTVRTPLSEIHLTFTEAVDQAFASVALLDATGHELTFGKLQPVGGNPSKEYVLLLEHPLVAGAFSVKWKVAGKDSHAVSGTFDFVVDVPGALTPVPNQPVVSPGGEITPAVSATDEHAHHGATESAIAPIFKQDTSIVWIVTRWLNFLGLLLMVGAVAFRFAVLNRAKFNDEAFTTSVDDAARKLAIFAAILVLITSGLRLWLQAGALSTPWQTVVMKSGWGKAWLAQTAAAFGFAITAAIRSEDRDDAWYSAGAFAVLAAATPAFSGHAAAVEQMAIVPMFDDAVHVIAASSWLGTLAFILLCGIPVAMRSDNAGSRVATMINTFSPFALLMGFITFFTGAMNAFVQITHVSDLWTTQYGKILAIKIALVAVTASMGAYNWKVVKPRLGSDETAGTLKKSATAEIVLAVVIIAVTAILVGTPTE